jgi:hypothetical protein
VELEVEINKKSVRIPRDCMVPALNITTDELMKGGRRTEEIAVRKKRQLCGETLPFLMMWLHRFAGKSASGRGSPI